MVKVHGIAEFCHAENGGKEIGVYPVFVTVLKARPSEIEELQKEVDAIRAAIAHICRRPAIMIHVIYQPPAEGRVAFGGKIVG